MTVHNNKTWPSARLTTPDAWVGNEMARRSDWKIVLSRQELAELLSALGHARATGKDIYSWTREDFPLPTLAEAIRGWLIELDRGRGFFLLKGFPVGEHSLDDCKSICWGMGLHMGRAVSQKHGR